MQIIWNPDVVEQMQKTQTLLELEEFDIGERIVTTYCVIPAEKLVQDLPQLENYKLMHNGFLEAMKDHDLKLCRDISEHLIGRFGGELDTFYQAILERLDGSSTR